jgi:tape measure domain-containing protein
MAYALGQVKGAGRLMGQEARQMTDAGFNPLAQIADEMAQKFGGLADKYMPELKKKMEDGKISFAEVERAITAATSAGGTFAGMTERINKETTKGAITNMRSEWSKLSASFGESITPLTVMGSSMASFTASALAFPFNKWNEWARTFDEISRLNKEMSKEMEKQVEHKTQFVRLTQKQKDDEKRVAFKDERKDFESQINSIDEEYRKKIIGEEKFKEMQLLTALSGNEMIAGDREKREEALWQMRAIKQMEEIEKAKKEREKEIESEQRAREQYGDKKKKIGEDLQEKQRKAQENTNPMNISQTLAPALKAGSVEAYKFMQGQKDKLYEAAQNQQKTLDEALAQAIRQTTALENQPLLNKKRG